MIEALIRKRKSLIYQFIMSQHTGISSRFNLTSFTSLLSSSWTHRIIHTIASLLNLTMAFSRTFHPFPRLPPELKLMIFQYYRDIKPSVRHYMHKGIYDDEDDTIALRFYAGIDIGSQFFDIPAQAFADTTARKPLPRPQRKSLRLAASGSNYYHNNNNDDDASSQNGKTRHKARLIRGTRSPVAGLQTIRTDLTLLSTTDDIPDWSTRDAGTEYAWIDVARDVVYLGGRKCQWLAPFAYGRDKSVPFDKLAPWFSKIQKLALRLPPASSDERFMWDGYCMNAQYRQHLTKWCLPDLKILYLVGFRDPACALGPPCRWQGFHPDEHLDENNYLPAATFVTLHGKEEQRTPGSATGCECVMDVNAAMSIQEDMEEELEPKTRAKSISIRVVVDPY